MQENALILDLDLDILKKKKCHLIEVIANIFHESCVIEWKFVVMDALSWCKDLELRVLINPYRNLTRMIHISASTCLDFDLYRKLSSYDISIVFERCLRARLIVDTWCLEWTVSLRKMSRPIVTNTPRVQISASFVFHFIWLTHLSFNLPNTITYGKKIRTRWILTYTDDSFKKKHTCKIF